MKIQRIIIMFTLLACCTANSMVLLKQISNFFDPDIEQIEEQINQKTNDESLSNYERNIQLAGLYDSLQRVYKKNENEPGFDPVKLKNFAAQQEQHTAAAADIKTKEFKIRNLLKKIDTQLHNPQFRGEQLFTLIPDYTELTKLDPSNQEHRTKLQKLEKLKLRNEVRNQISELEQTNNKRGLIVAYRTLATTYQSENNKAPCFAKIVALEQEVAEEARLEHAEILRAVRYREVNETIDAIAGDTSLSDLSRKMKLASALIERAKLCKTIKDESKQKQAEIDQMRAKTLRYEALGIATNPKTKDPLAEIVLLGLLTQN